MMTLLCLAMASPALAKNQPPAPPDYSSMHSWTVRTENPDKPYDVFYVHPTTYFNTVDGPNASLDNKVVRATTEATTTQQTGVFKDTCNIYAPRYRQVNRGVLPKKFSERDPYLSIAAQDVVAAFKYYLKHYNQGRPYVIASHSQGSVVTARVLKKHRELFQDDKIIAAYLVGWTITDKDCKEMKLPFAQRPNQTRCLITWNTISKGGKPPMFFPPAKCINPLVWTPTQKNQPKELNLGAVIDMGNGKTKKVPHFTSAQINAQGALVIPVPAMLPELNMPMGKGVYHRYDYDFFYNNFAKNVKDRCKAWSAMHRNAK
ncbi:MAG: DUF3089 domain-containing protein [Desulfarculaceae bacterium]|nr:DUF3089 domain-containing protein [Desulfarculaceae bacterium]MCF8072145.1 DUF3089 domain-containing protein [Desulfarculaceae bacterium]MCF8100066.1 DUF3089 domain-containing protein [Desulfarculaceae bacterium]MCF8118273.1 DUF3089 domain-containing protein [Desulfarculaceae bacterium]